MSRKRHGGSNPPLSASLRSRPAPYTGAVSDKPPIGNMKGSYFGIVALYLAALAVRTSYELLKKAGRVDPKSRSLFIMILLDMIVLWASWLTICLMDPAPLAFALLFSGRSGLGDSFRIGSPKESTGLKQTGLYRFSRNPMYVGVYATLCAAILRTLNPVLLVAAVYVIAIHQRIVLVEEAQMRQACGQEYRTYCSRVRRYL